MDPVATDELLVNDVAELAQAALAAKYAVGKALIVTGNKAVSLQPILDVQINCTEKVPVLI